MGAFCVGTASCGRFFGVVDFSGADSSHGSLRCSCLPVPFIEFKVGPSEGCSGFSRSCPLTITGEIQLHNRAELIGSLDVPGGVVVSDFDLVLAAFARW